jgi:hypothetical protein
MQNQTLQNPSPTLGGEQLKSKLDQLKLSISKWCKIIRLPKEPTKVLISIDTPDGKEVFLLSEIPPELHQAFHDYATRLVAEKYELETAIRNLA